MSNSISPSRRKQGSDGTGEVGSGGGACRGTTAHPSIGYEISVDFELHKVAEEFIFHVIPSDYENFIFTHGSESTKSKYTEQESGKPGGMSPMQLRVRGYAKRATLLALLFPLSLAAQTATLSGTATDSKGKPIANAAVSLKPGTGSPVEVQTDANGNYTIPDLVPGDYTLSASADGLRSKPIAVTVTTAPHQTVDLLMTPEQAQQLPNAPSAAPPANAPPSPSLEDLGFSTQQTQSNAQLQATLEKRTRMLRIHQKLGLFTLIPMTAAVITGPMAKAKGKNGETIHEPTQTNLDVHAALGGLTTAMYFTTAYYSIFAPRVPGNPKHGGIRWHEALAFVHGPGMVLTPILGIMAYNQENSGEKAHGFAAQHGTVAYVTVAAYGASIIAVSWPIWKSGKKK